MGVNHKVISQDRRLGTFPSYVPNYVKFLSLLLNWDLVCSTKKYLTYRISLVVPKKTKHNSEELKLYQKINLPSVAPKNDCSTSAAFPPGA